MQRAICLKIDKRAGEQTRKLLMKYGLIDHSRKIKATGNSIIIPLCKSPGPEETMKLEKITRIEICLDSLPTSHEKPRVLSELMQDLLPQKLASLLPVSHDVVGDIIILESLNPELLQYRKEIGSSFLKLNPGVKTVLLKTGNVEGKFRIPQLELIAGIAKFETLHLEYGIKLKVDLSKAYFSPRLGYERHRISQLVSDGETVVDMFAGVGPFSLMIAKKAKAKVYAIDVNPDAIRLLKENIMLNRIRGEVIPICGDARAVSGRLEKIADHVIMNLPSSSLEFLDAASMFIKKGGGVIHIYVFTSDESLAEAKAEFTEAAHGLLKAFEITGSRIVKPVAPRKWQAALDVLVKGE